MCSCWHPTYRNFSRKDAKKKRCTSKPSKFREQIIIFIEFSSGGFVKLKIVMKIKGMGSNYSFHLVGIFLQIFFGQTRLFMKIMSIP